MATRITKTVSPALLAITLALFGCGSDDEEKGPSSPSINLDSGSPGADSGIPVTPDTDGGTPDASTPSGDCKGANGCFSCTPKTNLELLNACAEGCRPFDNSRLPGYTPGNLPPL